MKIILKAHYNRQVSAQIKLDSTCIKKAGLEDAEELAELVCLSYADEGIYVEKDVILFTNQIKDKETRVYVYQVDKKIIAVFSYKSFKEKTRIMSFFILPEYKNQGLGSFLLEEMNKENKNCLEARVMVGSKANCFYLKKGFLFQKKIKVKDRCVNVYHLSHNN